MPTLKGISWEHPRGFAPMVSTASEYKKKNTEVEIIWDKRPLQDFADRPIEEMAYEYDLMVIDHPHVGEASRKELLIEFDKAEKFKGVGSKSSATKKTIKRGGRKISRGCTYKDMKLAYLKKALEMAGCKNF